MYKSITWPNDAKFAVVFSFDVDITAGWRHVLRRNKIERDDPVVLSIGEYGIKRGLNRILRLLSEKEIKATFFIPGIIASEYKNYLWKIYEDGHEIAFHGHRHIVPTKLSYEEEKKEFEMGINTIKEVFGIKLYGYRSPGEGLSDNTWRLILEHGLIYDSSMMDDDLPYKLNINGKPLIELPWRWVLDDWTYFGFNYFPPLEYRKCGPENPRIALEIWKDEFDVLYKEGLYLMFIGHPQQIGQPARIKALKKFIEYILAHDDVWVATAKEIATHALAYLK